MVRVRKQTPPEPETMVVEDPYAKDKEIYRLRTLNQFYRDQNRALRGTISRFKALMKMMKGH